MWKKSSGVGLNKAQCYDNNNGKGFQYLDFNSVLGIFFKKLNGLQKYQHFVFEATNPGIFKAQMVANGAFTEFNLLKIKTRKTSVAEIIREIKIFFYSSINHSSFGLQKAGVSLPKHLCICQR